MRVAFLDKITGEYARQWTAAWFMCGAAALFWGFWKTTEHLPQDWFYFAVSLIGLVCGVAELSP